MFWMFKTCREWLLGAGLLFASSFLAAETLQDCSDCSRLIVIQGGTFTMGSPANESERLRFEGPRDQVRVDSFAIGETEVTRGQYAVFVKTTQRRPPAHGCFKFGFNNVVDSSNVTEKDMDPRASWRDPGFAQTDQHPVTCISWEDANDYVSWLTQKTGKQYRLPSDAEFEYATRAGTRTIFPWGADENNACRYGNVGDLSLLSTNAIVRSQVETALREGQLRLRFVKCDDGNPYTAAVGQYAPNSFGLYDTIGNVWEYIADCWQESLPESGVAHDEAACKSRRARGGSWDDSPAELRSARRSRVKPDVPRNDAGFRVARQLTAAELAALVRFSVKD